MTCQLHGPGLNIVNSVAGLADVLTQVQTYPDCHACAQVTANTPMWIQAWGGAGGTRAGDGAAAGFAQMVTTLADLEGVGIIELYFYLGGKGSWNNTSGASGGGHPCHQDRSAGQSCNGPD